MIRVVYSHKNILDTTNGCEVVPHTHLLYIELGVRLEKSCHKRTIQLNICPIIEYIGLGCIRQVAIAV
jgi:hypothetical protein